MATSLGNSAVNPNVAKYSGTIANPSSHYSSLKTTYLGRALPNQVSALPLKTESTNQQLLAVVPSYGGLAISRQIQYGVIDPNTAGDKYLNMQNAYAKSSSICGTNF